MAEMFALALILIGGTAGHAAEWSAPVKVAEDGQFDAAVGPDGRIHLVSSRYVQLDAEGRVLLTENVGDGRQGALDFPPAIAVARDGAVHIVTRHGGDYNSGHEIRYRRRSPGGEWDLDLLVSRPVPRNYTVGAAATSDGRVWLTHSVHPPKENMNSYLECYEVAGGKVVHLGRIKGRYMRADDGQRMCAWGRFLHIATGNPWPRGKVCYFVGASGMGLPKQRSTHAEGAGRKGSPGLYPGKKGFVHFTYGAQESVWYNKYTADGRKAFPKDIQLADDLGKWHLSVGLSAVAASDDGKDVLVVMVRSDGTKEVKAGQLVWRHSPDWGMHWYELEETGFSIHAGEGRRRPNLLAIGKKFYLLFFNGSGIQLSTLELGERR